MVGVQPPQPSEVSSRCQTRIGIRAGDANATTTPCHWMLTTTEKYFFEVLHLASKIGNVTTYFGRLSKSKFLRIRALKTRICTHYYGLSRFISLLRQCCACTHNHAIGLLAMLAKEPLVCSFFRRPESGMRTVSWFDILLVLGSIPNGAGTMV